MLIWIKDADVLITAKEGTGDNLWEEDIANGFNDYIMTNVYKRDGYEFVEEDGGQLLTSEMVADLDQDEIVKRLLDYWGYTEEAGFDYIILEELI